MQESSIWMWIKEQLIKYWLCPIITTVNAGTKEFLGESRYGIVLENSNQAIEEGMREVLLNKKIRDKYYLAALERKGFVSLDGRMEMISSFINGDGKIAKVE